MTPIPSITDDVLKEIEALSPETHSIIHRLRESEAQLFSMCIAVAQKDGHRMSAELASNLEWIRGNMGGGRQIPGSSLHVAGKSNSVAVIQEVVGCEGK